MARIVLCSGVTGTGVQTYKHMPVSKGGDMGGHLIVDADSGVTWRILVCSPPEITTAKAVVHIQNKVGGLSTTVLVSGDMAIDIVGNTGGYSVNAVLVTNGV